MATTSPLTTEAQALVNTFATASGAHVEEVIKALKALPQLMKAKADASKMRVKHGLTAAKAIKKQRVKKTKQEKPTGGPKRPLNSWMAFRNYYNKILAPNTQKARSKVLTEWWKADLFEGKWSMLAKGYSIVRGNREKAEVPLQQYFGRCATLIGVIPPHEYQRVMGWQLGPPAEHDESKVPTIIRIFAPTLENFPEHITKTTLSVDDLVNHCVQTGLVTAPTGQTINTQLCALTMAVQPMPMISEAFPRSDDDELETALRKALSSIDENGNDEQEEICSHPMGETQLHAACTNLSGEGSFPYAETFYLASNFDFTFDPNANDDGEAFDSFDVNGTYATNG